MTLQVKGHVKPSAWGSQGVNWVLEYALGANPKDTDFHTVSTGNAGKSGVLGTIDTSEIPASYAAKNPTSTLPPDGPEQYTVSIRLRAKDGNGLKGEDRRSFGARTDTGMVDGFPKSIGTEISAAPAFVDLNGTHKQELVFGTNDGVVSALEPDGQQAAGFPVMTRQLRYIDENNPQNFNAASYNSVQGLREARDPISGIAIGDLTGDGAQSIVAATTSGWVYAWNRLGELREGFPVKPLAQYDTLPVPTPLGTKTRLPARGNWSAPALGDLQGDGTLDILMSSYDGHVYAWQPDGTPSPGWPVKVTLPDSIKNTIPPDKLIDDAKLMMTPGVGDLLGTGKDQVFIGGYQCDDAGNRVWAYGIQSDGNNHAGGPYMTGWPVALGALGGCYSQSIDFVQEGSNAVTIADFDGSGKARAAVTPVAGFPTILNADGSTWKSMQGSCGTATCGGIPPYYGADGLNVGVTGQLAIGDLKGSGKPNLMQPTAGGSTLQKSLGDAGQASLIHVFDQAWDPATGDTLDSFPTDQDGFPFFVSPIVANLTNDNTTSMISSNDSYWIHARGPDGKEAPGFPKWTGQWTSFGGVVGDPNYDGQQNLAYGTREGQLFMWKVGGSPEKSDEWSHYRHDEHNSGNYGKDVKPPAGVSVKVKRNKKRAKLTWHAPGQNGVSNGKISKYEIYRSGKSISIPSLATTSAVKAPAIGEPGAKQTLRVNAKTKKPFYIGIRSQDSAGNWSQLSVAKVKRFKINRKLIKKKRKVCKKKLKKRLKRFRGNKRKVKKVRYQNRKCVYKAKKAGGLSPKKPKKHKKSKHKKNKKGSRK
ncbi:MAG: hypothetical protein IPK93_00085 [Solirubrobacterales bacterium]|nr:hypothetical protein [Solirubrobacterales bacterium]